MNTRVVPALAIHETDIIVGIRGGEVIVLNDPVASTAIHGALMVLTEVGPLYFAPQDKVLVKEVVKPYVRSYDDNGNLV